MKSTWIFIGLMLKLKFQYFGHLMWKADSLEKTLMLGGEVGNRGRDGWIASMGMSLSKLQRWWRTGERGMLQTMGSHRVRFDLVTEQQQSEFSWGSPKGNCAGAPSFPNCPSLQRGSKAGSSVDFTSYTRLLQSAEAFSNFRSRELV